MRGRRGVKEKGKLFVFHENSSFRGEKKVYPSYLTFSFSFYTSLNYCSAILRESELPQPTHWISQREREREGGWMEGDHPKETCFATEIQWNRGRIAQFPKIRLNADESAVIPLWTHVLETVGECATSSVSHLLEVAHSALLIGCRVQEKLIQFVEAHTVSHRREGVEMVYALL